MEKISTNHNRCDISWNINAINRRHGMRILLRSRGGKKQKFRLSFLIATKAAIKKKKWKKRQKSEEDRRRDLLQFVI